MFSWATLGPVVVVKQTMNATGYLKMIADQLHPYMSYVFLAGNGMFQLDNAPCQKSRIVLEWFQEQDAEFQLMSWPPNSIRYRIDILYQSDRIHLGCHGWQLPSSKTTNSQYLGFVSPLLKHLVQSVFGHLPRTCGTHAKAG
ncbi:transposable element Tc1 transposase [Trichonephila clavipes]|nr:transposable element Tc1 transposase [Trichonephila clavipes]